LTSSQELKLTRRRLGEIDSFEFRVLE